MLIYGEYALVPSDDPGVHDDPGVYAYRRTGEGAVLTIVLNFTKKEIVFPALTGPEAGTVLINNYPDVSWGEDGESGFQPCQAVVFGRRNPHHRLEGLFSPSK